MKQFFIAICMLIYVSNALSQEYTLVSPINHYVSEDPMVEFIWNKGSEVNTLYTLQLSKDPSFSMIEIDSTIHGNALTLDLSLLKNQQLYWRILNNQIATPSVARHFFIIDFYQIDNLAIWLQGDSVILNGANVTEWKNLADTSFTFKQNTSNRQPIYFEDSLQAYHGIRFRAGKELVGNKNVFSNEGVESFILAKPNPISSSVPFLTDQGFATSRGSGILLFNNKVNTYLPGSYGGGAQASFNTGFLPYSIISRTVDFTNGEHRITLNNILDTTIYHSTSSFSSTSINPSYKYKIGGQAKAYNHTRNFNGYIYEIIVFKDTVFQSNLDRSVISNYLHHKYSPFPNLGEDKIANYSLCGPTSHTFNISSHYIGQVWSDLSIDTSLTVEESGTYYVEIEDVFGYTLRDTVVVKFPYKKLPDTTVVCSGDTAIINPELGQHYTFLWSTNETDSIIQVDQTGLYTFTATDSFGCTYTDQTYVIKDSIENNISFGSDTTFCLNTSLDLNYNGSIYSPLDYQWSTGDSTSSILLQFTGDSTISVSITDKYLCTTNDTIDLTVYNILSPSVDFIADTVCPFSPTHFTDLSVANGTDIISSWEWHFSDTIFSVLQNPTFTFADTTLSVILRVETDSGCSNEISKFVHFRDTPHADFNAAIACARSLTTFSDASSIHAPDSVIQWYWTFDNNSSTLENPNYAFDSAGSKNVTLRITASNGCTDTTSKTITVYPALVPDFETDNRCLGDSTQFIDRTPSFSTVSRIWDFGNGQFTTEENPQVLYADTGTYNVSLFIENALGCESDTSKTITILAPPTAYPKMTHQCLNDLTLFYDSSSTNAQHIDSFYWTINHHPFVGDSVRQSFQEAGNYSLSYQIKDAAGCVADTSLVFEIFPKPIPQFTITPNYGEAPLDVNFTNATDSAIFYTWNFDENNAQSSNTNPTYTYTQNGVYTIVLIAENQQGCIDSTFKELTVAPTEVDIEVTSINYYTSTLSNSDIAYNPTVNLKNVGTRTIYNTSIYVSIDQDKQIVEKWVGTLLPGESLAYTFQSSIIVRDEDRLQYMCATAQNTNDNTEVLLNNNTSCKILNGKIQLSAIYPNPTTRRGHITLISKEDGEIAIRLYDYSGSHVLDLEKVQIVKGYNQISIDCVNLLSGKYIVDIIHHGEHYKLPLVVSH